MREDLIKALLSSDARFDAKTSLFLAQQLETIESAVYNIEYPELKWRRFIPVDGSYDEGVETISYYEYDMFGMAEWIANYAKDLPNVSIRGEKFSSTVEGIGASYHYSTQDLRAAAFANIPLTSELAEAAAEFIERKLDEAAAFGAPELNMGGFTNATNVPIDTAADNGAGSTFWVDKTSDQILADLHALTVAQWEETVELHPPTNLILPTSLYGLIATKRIGVDVGTTVLQMFGQMNPWVSVQGVDSWNRLETASATGTPRIVCYKKNPRVVKAAMPMEVKQYEPERRSLGFSNPLEARFGGVLVRMPLAMRYLDGAA